MIACTRRKVVIFLLISLCVLISILYGLSLNNKRKLLITIVDYRWMPIGNISVRLETIEQYYQEYYTDDQGQVRFDLENYFNIEDYVQVSVGEINEQILPMEEEVTIRLRTINQSTGEMYDDEIFN